MDEADHRLMSGLQWLAITALGTAAVLVCFASAIKRRLRRRRARHIISIAAQVAQRHTEASGQGKDPLPPHVRESLPVSSFNFETCQMEDCTCSICLVEYEEAEEIVTLPCKHVFHSLCLEPWFDAHSSCPLCRSQIQLSPTQSSEVVILEIDGDSVTGESEGSTAEERVGIGATEGDGLEMAEEGAAKTKEVGGSLSQEKNDGDEEKEEDEEAEEKEDGDSCFVDAKESWSTDPQETSQRDQRHLEVPVSRAPEGR